MDYFIGPPSVHSQQVHRTDLYEVPILRMYGVTEAGARHCLACCMTRMGVLPLPCTWLRLICFWLLCCIAR